MESHVPSNWTNEKHVQFLNTMEASFVCSMIENKSRLARLDRYMPDTSDSTQDLNKTQTTKKHSTPGPVRRMDGGAVRRTRRLPSRPFITSHQLDQVVPQLEIAIVGERSLKTKTGSNCEAKRKTNNAGPIPDLQESDTPALTLLLTLLKIPILFLRGLHTYIHPDNIPPGGSRAAIRRPDSSDSGPELRKRSNKSKDKKNNPAFDENNAQIFRLKLDEAHLQTRLYFPEYSNAFTFSFVAISSLLLQIYLNNTDSSDSGFLVNGVFVPVLLGFAGVSKLLVLVAKVSFEKSASRRSEKQLSVLLGVVGLLVGSMVCFTFSPSVFDFHFGSIDSNGRLFIALLMGCFSGFLFMPAAKSARSFWLGTDQIRSDLSMLSCEWFGRMILYANYTMILFTVLLWINPFAGMLMNKNGKVQNAESLIGNMGFSTSDFAKFRLCCLLVSSFLQLVALRPNLQMYLNEALLSWYQRLHAGKVPDLEFSRAKVFLHNHYLCLTVLQFLAPPIVLLLFLGLSRIDGISSEDFHYVCSLLPCSAFVKEMAVFMAWWILFVWAVYSSATIFLYRRCILYMS